MQWPKVSNSREWESTKSPNTEPYGMGTMNSSYIGSRSESPDKLWMSLILVMPEGFLEDFQVIQPPEKFVCIFSCTQIAKAAIQRYSSVYDYGIALWFLILRAGSILKDQTQPEDILRIFVLREVAPPAPEMGQRKMLPARGDCRAGR